MSSFLLFLRLSTACEFDETFLRARARARASLFILLSLSFPVSRFPFLASLARLASSAAPLRSLSFPIPLHPYCQCNPRAIQRNLVSSRRRLFPSVTASQLSTSAALSNSAKKKTCSPARPAFPSSLEHHLLPVPPPPSSSLCIRERI